MYLKIANIRLALNWHIHNQMQNGCLTIEMSVRHLDESMKMNLL